MRGFQGMMGVKLIGYRIFRGKKCNIMGYLDQIKCWKIRIKFGIKGQIRDIQAKN